MIDLKKLQKEIYKNKVAKKFNVEDINLEFCYLHGELAEAHKAYRDKLPDLGEELADVTIYLLGLAEILGVDLEKEIINKVTKNQKREYKWIDGKLTRTKEAKL
jgi:NTP pyrophosphatase (non-canonical NTP hydrolase)